ncbi:hypothetical protein VZ95_02820 [Elstera litoralis]|uniref:Uncharacterized protein n=1 Tax=Elstera litoralis TaxID=552518 RepID=A0A0F3IW25_9PROT|nr:DUF6441 family protein [Elstera litoralis]KJV10743.1 hypothetical protein VZ95_02820 [Elstera litoralis]
MSLNLELEAQIKARMEKHKKRLKRYMTLAATEAGAWTRDELQRQAASFMHKGRSSAGTQDPIRSIRLTIYPKSGDSLGAAAEIRFAANWWRAHIEGPEVITAAGGRWMAIPLPAAIDMGLDRTRGDRGAGMRLSKRANIPKNLRFVPFDGGRRALLVMDALVTKAGKTRRLGAGKSSQRGASIPLFLLVRSVRLPKRIDVKKAERDGFQRYVRAVTRGVESAFYEYD